MTVDNKKEIVLMRGSSYADTIPKGSTVLMYNEFFIETDTLRLKKGDGVTPYNKLPYLPYSEITVRLINLWNQASVNGLSWINSPAYGITLGDIATWNAATTPGISEDDAIAMAVAL